MDCFRKYIFRFLALFGCMAACLTLFGSTSLADKGQDRASIRIESIESLEWLQTKDDPFIIELFTSTDCSGCNMADTFMFKFAKFDNAIVLSCHVDYLTYSREEDKTGLESCTHRQWYYTENRWTGETELMTPQFVINGSSKINGTQDYHLFRMAKSVFDHSRPPKWANMKMVDDHILQIDIPEGTHLNAVSRNSTHGVWLIRYQDSKILKIKPSDSEKPLIMRYTNLVRNIRHIARWYGEERSIRVDIRSFPDEILKEQGGWVIVVHEVNGDPITIAGKLTDKQIYEAKANAHSESK